MILLMYYWVLPETIKNRLFGIRISNLGVIHLGVELIFWKLFMRVFEFQIEFGSILLSGFEFSEKTRLVFC